MMIKIEELSQIGSIDVVEKIYEEIMLNGANAIPAPSQEAKIKIFSKVCHDLVQQYVTWNDYIHSNNIMQLFKSVAFRSESNQKPGWFVRYEIIIYGRRTPLYYIDNPKVLFSKIAAICTLDKANQKDKLSAAIGSLFNYYKNNFLSGQVSNGDKELFKEHFRNIFAKEYKNVDKSLFPSDVTYVFDTFIDYIDNPDKFVEPGITNTEFELWDEDEEFVVQKVESLEQEPAVAKPEETKNIIHEPEYKAIDVTKLPERELKYLNGKVIRFIGALNKPSIKSKLHGISKQYGFEVEMFDDYDKIANMDFSKMRYSNRISGIIAGPMPHKIKGMGGYSSGLEMLKSESGYPPVFECYAGEQLKITTTSLWRALLELNKELAAK